MTNRYSGYDKFSDIFFLLFSMYSNSHNFRNNDQAEMILVPNDAECDQKLSGLEFIVI